MRSFDLKRCWDCGNESIVCVIHLDHLIYRSAVETDNIFIPDIRTVGILLPRLGILVCIEVHLTIETAECCGWAEDESDGDLFRINTGIETNDIAGIIIITSGIIVDGCQRGCWLNIEKDQEEKCVKKKMKRKVP